MEFTYKRYADLINLLKSKGYYFCNYLNCDEYKKAVIFRHDIDTSLEKALEIAKLEYKYAIKSTYFVLLSTNFYNVFSKESDLILKKIIDLGHDIGLHFDEKRYYISNENELEYWVNREKHILELALNKEVKVVSMHRPSKWILENDIQFQELINTYSKKFFSNFKYLSDSRMHWREDVIEIIETEIYDKLHILTHPFWYSNEDESIKQKIEQFINNAKKDRYIYLKDNIRDIDQIVDEGELLDEN